MKEKNIIEKLLELPEEKLDEIIEKLATNKLNKLIWKLQDLFKEIPEKCYQSILESCIDNIEHHINQDYWNNECIYCDRNTTENIFVCKNCGEENVHYYKESLDKPKEAFICSLCKFETINEKQVEKNNFWEEYRNQKYKLKKGKNNEL